MTLQLIGRNLYLINSTVSKKKKYYKQYSMTIVSFYLKMFSKHIEYINARENRSVNKEWTIQRLW
jgi:hypothetical protein